MAKQKDQFKDIAKKSSAELGKMLAEARDRLWTLRTDLAAGKVKNVREMHGIKIMIARLLTAKNQTKA